MSQYLKPTLYNLALTLAATEYPQALPADTRKILIRERTGVYDLQLSYASGQSGVVFFTIPAGSSKMIENLYLHPNFSTIYLQCAQAGVTVEIEAWQ